MWIIALFDLPVKSKKDRREYTRFRFALKSLGFVMLQFSVYARYDVSPEAATALREKVKRLIPPKGEVRLLSVTDRQFARMEIIEGKRPRKTEEAPEQLMLF
ncbi:MAG: CRISPR-associated endonuclease Cas2 [Proteobacteria bacterium]|nr:CRISPR-associated endonuclease Cas2 [Pseudomonadota bacterium]